MFTIVINGQTWGERKTLEQACNAAISRLGTRLVPNDPHSTARSCEIERRELRAGRWVTMEVIPVVQEKEAA